MKNILVFSFLIILATGCSSQKAMSSDEKNQQHDGRKKPPSIDDVFKMDSNNDGLLSKDEVEGPLQRDFDNIDSNSDGFITREELEKAPKPERGPRGQRPPRKK